MAYYIVVITATEVRVRGQKYGVVEAVNEFVVTRNYEMVFLTMEAKRSVSYGLRADDNELNRSLEDLL